MKSFLTKNTKFTNIRVFSAPIILLFIGILFMPVSIKAQSALDSFMPNPNGRIHATVVQPDGKIIIGGLFTNLSGLPRNYIARLNSNGTPDTALNPNATNYVYTITVQPNGKIFVGGEFTSVGGSGQKYISRLNATGTADYSFYINVNGAVSALALQSDGTILIGGSFTTVNAYPRSYIARLKFDGSLDTSFNANANAAVRTLTLQPDGKIIVGGSFTGIGGQWRSNFARLNNTSAALSTLNISPTTLLLTRDGAAAQFSRLIFEQSVDNGVTWMTLGTAANSVTTPILNDKNDASAAPFAFTSCGYILTGQNIPTGQNVLIRARGFYRAGEKNGSEIVADKVQNVFLPAPTAGIVSISGHVITQDYSGLRNALVQVQFANGDSVTT